MPGCCVRNCYNSTENATICCDALKTCCNLFKKIMKRYIAFRIKIDCKKGRLKNKVYNSKTMARHAIIT